MTDLRIRKIRFDLDDDVPFLWNPANPAFSLQMNATSIIAIAFERFIVAAVSEVLPTITDPGVYAEAHAFMLQEGQHSRAHRQHVAGLIRRYPALQETLDAAVASYDELTATKPVAWRLGYVADLEATFTPTFKLMLDHQETLFAPGDERVASLFLWHFVEEVEHRSSGLIIYDACVGSRSYRTRMLPDVVRHLRSILDLIIADFDQHVPATDRVVGSRELYRWKAAYETVSWRARLAAARGILFSQLPAHDPANAALPAFAGTWFQHFEDGGDVAHWYTSTGVSA